MKHGLGFVQLGNMGSCQSSGKEDIHQNPKVEESLQAHEQVDWEYRIQPFNMMDGKYSEYITSDMAKHYVVFDGPYVNKSYFKVDDRSQWKEVSFAECLMCGG